MNRSTVASRWNLDVVEANYSKWQQDPEQVDATWRAFFEGYSLAQSGDGLPCGGVDPESAEAQAGVTRLSYAYREIGHYLADLDPLGLTPPRDSHELLDLAEYALKEGDLDRHFHTMLVPSGTATLREILAILRETYCRTIGVEYMHIRDPRVRKWLRDRMESSRNRPTFELKKKQRILWKLKAAALFERFLHSRYQGQKRFSLEGGEMLIPLLDAVVERAGRLGVREIVLGMSHRGRLNVLANILDKPYGLIFSEFEGSAPKTVAGDGDVKYHLGFSADRQLVDGNVVHLSLTPNPSHLEAVNPVVEGRVRAKQRRFNDANRKLGLPVLIHGDAAFAGQGLVAETLNLSQLTGYKTGGTVHIVVNNQIGFTTSPADGRSSRYCTDVAKMIEVPIFHVNGEDPEAVILVAEMAMDFRHEFAQDVVIDMVCYRKHGHNEGDEPAFTQPLMYAKIKDRKSIDQLYTETLVAAGELSTADAETIVETFNEKMDAIFKEVHVENRPPRTGQPGFASHWKGFTPNFSFAPVETGVPVDRLTAITRAITSVPSNYHRHPKLDRILGDRTKAMESGTGIDWSFAEALSFGSLLMDGIPVRLSGQDSRRGTFSQRHSVIVDSETGEKYVPLNNIQPGHQAELSVYDSLLSEAAVLGFDYGYSLEEPNMLILWEAQFGDFANGAQVIIDQFIASAESKWGRASGLVMLLPHGYEGQGPEHSSARLERFLSLCAEDNIQVVYASTPAQYFHVLRRQIKRNFRKPLILMTPKSMLRNKVAVSSVTDLVTGRFREVIDDTVEANGVRRVVVCSGKLYYDLAAARAKGENADEVAIVRLEQLYPWPAEALSKALGRYNNASEWVWAQEESQNMGAWTFVAPRLRDLIGESFDYVGRDPSASPATGSHAVHEREQVELVEAALGASLPHLVGSVPAHSVGASKS